MPIMVTQISTDNKWSLVPVRQQQQWLIVSINPCSLENFGLSDCLSTNLHPFVRCVPICTTVWQFIWAWSHQYPGREYRTQPHRLLRAILDVLHSPAASQKVSLFQPSSYRQLCISQRFSIASGLRPWSKPVSQVRRHILSQGLPRHHFLTDLSKTFHCIKASVPNRGQE